MTHEYIRDFCLKKKAVTEEFPFDNETLVFKVMNKMFLLMSLESHPASINVKCDPELAIELRDKYPAVSPAYHMNKKHWNSVEVNGTISAAEILKMIDDSYNLVVKSLPKKIKEQLNHLA
ncbi:MAG TPA: MmcQ/YjbR family DNA-binding protein [Chitinophagales bacterium]|nr:MmcQ/YjbR family DNA-binding protein [Chitinophagales bacterium]